jgi:hypothetical protein
MANETRPIYVTQTRAGVYSMDGTVAYKITTVVHTNNSYSGDTRDCTFLLNLFVNTIVDSTDSTQDTFSNYATLADLDLVKSERSVAIASGSNKYRDCSNTITFDNLSVASTAAKVVRDTINNIVDTYLKVKDSFIGSDTHYFPYPKEVGSLRDQYIQAYTAGKDVRVAAEQAQEEAQSAYVKALSEEAIRKECQVVVCDLAERLTAAQALIPLVATKYKETMLGLIASAEAAGEDTLDGLKTWIGDNLVEAQLLHDSTWIEAIDESSGSGLSLLALIIQVANKAQVDCMAAGSTLSALETTVQGKLSDLKEKQELKAAASQVEETALGTLAVYCPNLDPASL